MIHLLRSTQRQTDCVNRTKHLTCIIRWSRMSKAILLMLWRSKMFHVYFVTLMRSKRINNSNFKFRNPESKVFEFLRFTYLTQVIQYTCYLWVMTSRNQMIWWYFILKSLLSIDQFSISTFFKVHIEIWKYENVKRSHFCHLLDTWLVLFDILLIPWNFKCQFKFETP